MAFNGFRGTAGGSVQTTYTDQPGVASAGMLAFASEEALALIDSYIVGEANGIAAGRGVVLTQVATPNIGNLQAPNQTANLPSAGNTVTDFAGIAVWDATMQSDSNGVPGYNQGRLLRVMRKGRSGGRIYVKVMDTIAVTDTVYLVTVASTDGNYQPGDFTNGTPAGATTATLATVAKWITPATGTTAAPAVAMIELL